MIFGVKADAAVNEVDQKFAMDSVVQMVAVVSVVQMVLPDLKVLGHRAETICRLSESMIVMVGLVECEAADFRAGARAYLIGLAFLKANDPNKAFEYLTKSLNDLNWNAREIAYAPLAIACNRQNKLGDAQSFLQKSEQYLNRSLENMSATVMQPQRGQPWFDLVEALVVHRQAAQSILKQEDAVVGKLESIHQKALRQLEGSL